MDRDDELAEGTGGGDGTRRTHLQLSGHDFNVRSEIDYYHAPDEKNELLRNCTALKNHRKEIAAFFEVNDDRKERGDFIKSFFDETFVEHILENGERVGYRAYDDLLHIWHGSYLSRDKEDFIPWWRVGSFIQGQILLDTWLTAEEEGIISEEGQFRIIEESFSEKQNEFVIPQAAIDYVLTRGSGMSQGKMRIYEQFIKQEFAEKNIAFLKNEYGIGGYSDPIPESGSWEQHDGKGIMIKQGETKILLSWNKVANRIGELIAADRYLNRREKEAYPAFLKETEDRRKRGEIADRFNSLVSDFNEYENQIENESALIKEYESRQYSASFVQGERVIRGYGNYPDEYVLPSLRRILERIISENTHLSERARKLLDGLSGEIAKPFELTESEKNPPPEPKKEYRFSLGDKVFIGAKEYEIIDFNDPVALFDPEYPIFTQEMPKDEFLQKAGENPLNDNYLYIVDEPDTETHIYFDSAGEEVTWMYYSPDSERGGQYVQNTLSFEVFKETVELFPGFADDEEQLDRLTDELESTADQYLADPATPFFIESEAAFSDEPDYTGLTAENIRSIYDRIDSVLIDKEAERDLNAHEAEFGADGARVFRDPAVLSEHDKATDILNKVLYALKIYDISLKFEG
ncbi:MAG: hypothetical protein IJT91_06300, partial [Clostridia bacterium]|nr:hypothetical protein [Clostridia bacterium]